MPDPHGNVAGQAQAAALTTALRYDGYGQTIASAPASLPAQARRWKYQGRLDIAPDGLAAPLYDFSARFYSPGLGSFTQLDPMQGSALDPLTLNRYLYAAANPATLIDPTGHFTMEKDDAPGSHCKNRGDTGCGETAVAKPGRWRWLAVEHGRRLQPPDRQHQLEQLQPTVDRGRQQDGGWGRTTSCLAQHSNRTGRPNASRVGE